MSLTAALRSQIFPRARSVLASRQLSDAVARVFSNDVPSRGLRFRIDNPAIGSRTAAELFFRLYERHEIGLVRTRMLTTHDVVELGAGIGVTGSYVLSRLAPGRQLISVEANAAVLPTLRSNLERHSRGHKFTIVHGGVSYSGESTVTFATSAEHMTSRVNADSALVDTSPQPVSAITLSTLVERFGLADYVLIADIEGAEWDILTRDSKALDSCGQIIIEMHGDDSRITAMVRMLADQGFAVTEQRKAIYALTRAAALTAG